MSRSFFTKAVSVLVVLVIAGSLSFIGSSYAAQSIYIVINGKEVTSDVPPEVENNRVLVPIRVISEGLGAQVIWDEDNNQVIVNSENTGNTGSQSPTAGTGISIVINGKIVDSDVPPLVKDNRVLVPLRVISENLGAQVIWDGDNYQVVITKEIPDNNSNVSIFGQSEATSAQLKALLAANNPDAPDLVDLYLSIGREYGIRGDIAFCQAAKETGWWRFTGIVQPGQNNYCGLWATGTPNTGLEDLHGADPTRVWFVQGSYGAYFDSPATGVEAQIQHLYAYACTKDLPDGKVLLDPRFNLVNRGCAPNWVDLGGKWAVPGYNRSKYASFEEAFANGETYGQSILTDYYAKALKY